MLLLLLRVVGELGLGLVATLFSDAHQHGELRLEVHVVEQLFGLVVGAAILVLLLLLLLLF